MRVSVFVFSFFLTSSLALQFVSVLDRSLHITSPDSLDSLALIKKGKLQKKLKRENIPIFEFRNDISSLLENAESVELEPLFHEYMILLRDYYLDIFKSKCTVDASVSTEHVTSVFYETMNECRRAMDSAKPTTQNCEHWDFEGYLVELDDDIRATITELSKKEACEGSKNDLDDLDSDQPEIKATPRNRLLSMLPFKINFRWMAAQLLMLGFNFFQNEIRRRTAIHGSEKRLAEVPEFPLL